MSATQPQAKTARAIQQELERAHRAGLLDRALTAAMLPELARALTPTLERYVAQHGVFPPSNLMVAMANHFNQDGPLVMALLQYHSAQAAALWGHIQQRLMVLVQRHWPDLDAVQQDKVVGEAYLRVYRHLPKFMFQAKLDTWIFTIVKNEYLRLKTKPTTTLYLEDPLSDNLTLGETLPAPDHDPSDVAMQRQQQAEFWAQVARLGDQSGVEILKLHLAGYKLAEIQQALGPDAPVVSTIQRRLQRILDKLKNDPMIRNLAKQWGLLMVMLVNSLKPYNTMGKN